MKNINGEIYLHNCIMMKLDTFTELIEKLTKNQNTVEYEFGAYITDNDNADTKEIEDFDINELLSEYFDVNVTSWHSDTNEDAPCVWIIYGNV